MRKTYWIGAGLLAAWCVGYSFGETKASDGGVPYPEGFRKWTFLHSTLTGPKAPLFAKRPCEKPCTGGIFYFYANEKAMEGMRTGTYADGAIFADEVLEIHGNSEGAGKEGPRRGVGVMVKDRQKYAATGGWGFASYEGDGKTDILNAEAKQNCFQCHVPKKDKDYVFTSYRER
jgi:hypothetical protein